MDLEGVFRHEVGVRHHRAVKRKHRGQAFDAEFLERAACACDGLGARGAGDDELGHQRVEGAGHLRAGVHAGVHAHARARGGVEHVDGAGRRQEAAAHVFGVDAEFEGVAARCGRFLDGQRQAFGDAQLFDDEVDAGGLLGHGVLDLQARVDLEK
ncbi:hypothetical protein D3C87_1156060 [compost metagenome]